MKSITTILSLSLLLMFQVLGQFTIYQTSESDKFTSQSKSNPNNDPVSHSVVPHPDLAGLKALYDATNGQNWENNTGWETGINDPESNPCDGWFGITCNSTGRVAEIELRFNKVSGTLPEAITSIEFLKELSFYYNSLTGEIPLFLTEFNHLEYLDFNRNEFTGTIPVQLASIQTLQELDLGSNNLTGIIPPELGELINLEDLDLERNELEGNIPQELGDLALLERLNLQFNNLEGDIPVSLGNLSKLRGIQLGGNQFEGEIPDFFGNWTNLLSLSLHRNNFSGELPASLSNLTKLQNLILFENNISGPIFDLVVQFPSLSTLSIDNNNFSGEIPNNILEATNLNSIDLSYNNFSGSIPGVLGDQSFYNYLRLNNNDFSGCFDPKLYAFCGNDKIDFSNNQKLPWQGDLDQYCMTSGSEEDQIGAPCNAINSIAETITENCECLPSCDHPDFIGLMSLYSSTLGSGWYKKDGWKDGAAGNNCDPCSWYGVGCNDDGRVTSIGLIENNLRGSLTDKIDELTELQILTLAVNKIGGQVPESLYNLTNLTDLRLSTNNFYGPISENLGNLVNLTKFSLANCSINGTLPSTLGNLTELTEISLYSNDISGDLPPGITNLTKLEYLSLDGNSISGSLPEDIGNLSSLRSLRFPGNNLTGAIPASLGDLENLFIVYFQNNNLSGCFDPNLLNLCDIGELRFTNNIDLPWGGEFDKFCATSGEISEQEGAFCGLGGSGIFNNCECIKSSDICYTPEGLLCKEWVQDLIAELDCYDFGFGQRANYNLAVSNYKEDPVLVVLASGEFASEVYSTQIVYTCEGELLESCSYSLGTNCGDSITIFSQLIPYPTTFYKCMEDVLPDCSMFVQHPDFSALADFFYSTDGLHWSNNEGWREMVQDPFSDPCEGWYGVTCDNGRVTSIVLENNNLNGTIPTSIEQLQTLQHLDLNSNNLTGNVLESITKLTDLTFLSLADNELTGPIINEISNLQKLTFLNLGWNKFSGALPIEISNCTQLTSLFFNVNELTGEIPPEYAQMQNLEILRFDNNDLSGCIPSEFLEFCTIDITFQGNQKLPFLGDLTQFCMSSGSSSEQVGAPCDDGDDTNGTNDIIKEDCSCAPKPVSTNDTGYNHFSIYPNPTSDQLYISGQLDGEVTFKLIDLIGHIVKKGKLTLNQIAINDVSQGIYFLELYHLKTNKKEVFKVFKE